MAPSLEDLLNQNLSGIISSGGLGNEDAMYQRQALADREALSGRGLGISTVTRDALAKARVDASLAAQQAQLAALGQAAGITQGNANRAQNESQFSRNLSQQKDMANTQMLASGLGAGVGALGQLGGAAFGPEIRGGLRSMFGLGPLRQDAAGGGAGGGVPAGAAPTSAASTIPTGGYSLGGAGSSGGGLNLDLANLGGAGSGGDVSSPDLSSYFDPGSFGGGLDLSAFYDQSFNPYQQDTWGWY